LRVRGIFRKTYPQKLDNGSNHAEVSQTHNPEVSLAKAERQATGVLDLLAENQ